jgi:hypothetical protein
MLVFSGPLRRVAPVLGALLLSSAGCAETPGQDAAFARIQRLEAAARANEARIAVLEERQGMSMQHAWMMSGFVSTLARDVTQRDEALERQSDELEVRVEQTERTGAELAQAVQSAESPQALVRRVQAMIDAGQVKVVVKNGRARIVGGPALSSEQAKKASAIDVVPELENPWDRPRKPQPPPSNPLGF